MIERLRQQIPGVLIGFLLGAVAVGAQQWWGTPTVSTTDKFVLFERKDGRLVPADPSQTVCGPSTATSTTLVVPK